MSKMLDDLKNLKTIFTNTKHMSYEIFSAADKRKVAHTNLPTLELDDLPKTGYGAESTLSLFEKSVLPKLSGSVGPNFLGFITGGTTPAALIADWLVSALDQNVMISGDSITVEFERYTIGLLKKLFKLSLDEFYGIFTTGATASNICAMAVAREWAGERLGFNFSKEGVSSGKIRIYSAMSHSSINKALSLVGIGRDNLIQIPCMPGCEIIDVRVLSEKIQSNSNMINIVVANAGTVNTGCFDPIQEISEICKQHNAWLHVDAAFGIFTRLSPKMLKLTDGLEKADSITADVHKWLNVPYDCGLFLTKHFKLQKRVFQNNAAYLESATDKLEPMDGGIENSRRFRALPVWFTLIAYGSDSYRNLVELHCKLATELGTRLKRSGLFMIFEEPRINILCFAPLRFGSSTINTEFTNLFLSEINSTGKVFFTPTVLNNQRYIRAAFSNWRTQLNDLDLIVEILITTHQFLSNEHNTNKKFSK